MKAIRLHKRGGPEQLVYEDAPKPELSPGDALIRVRATSITPTELTWAETYSNCDGSERLPTIPGHEVSVVVESAAEGVGDVSIGDEVYALTSFCRNGGAAEYVAIRADDLAPKPKTLDHAQAAAVPLSALTVWQAFFDHARLAPGQRVLIHGELAVSRLDFYHKPVKTDVSLRVRRYTAFIVANLVEGSGGFAPPAAAVAPTQI